MITRILINNSPAFSLLELHLKNGFNVFSGASGSGKSVFMESLLGIFGIKDSNAELIEANIATSKLEINLDEYGILDDEEIVLSILKKEKTRYFLNHQSSSKKRLNEIVSGFGKHISARSDEDMNAKNILRIFDDFIIKQTPKHAQILKEYKATFIELKDTLNALETLKNQESQIASLKEIATFEINQIDSIAPKEGEYEELLELKKTLSKQEKIAEGIKNVQAFLDQAGCVDNFLALSDESCIAFSEGVRELEAIIESKLSQLQSLEDTNPEQILERISSISTLVHKYGSVANALNHAKEQKQKLEQYENMDFTKNDLVKKSKALQDSLHTLDTQLHTTRQNALKDFQNTLSSLTDELHLKPLSITLNTSTKGERGSDECAITLGGSGISTLSAGEYNRLRLGLMCIDASVAKRAGILVLDEIDANLSGQESEGVAKILKKLSTSYQIFAISHQPHMPTLADNHYLVYKNGAKSEVKLLDSEGRANEIARMISGAHITKEALEFAKQALSKNKV